MQPSRNSVARTGFAAPPIQLDPPAAVLATVAERWLQVRTVNPSLGAITLHPHQVSAAARLLDLLEAHGGAMLADEAGLGKTYVALAVARAVAGQDENRFLIVAPAALREMWKGALRCTNLSADFLSFEALSRGGSHRRRGEALIVVDEAHHVRNPRARRYRALAHVAWGARVLLLTATPVHNRLRDLRAQLRLFLGARAMDADRAWLLRFVVRRRQLAPGMASPLPRLEPLAWLPVDPAPELLCALSALPPAVPPADGGVAHALLQLGLLRAWASSDGALRAALRRRLLRAGALAQALESGRRPTRRELRAWALGRDAVQLGFPELLARHEVGADAGSLLDALTRHTEGVRNVLDVLEQCGDRDAQRVGQLRALRVRHAGARIVALTQFADTATALYRRLDRHAGVALVTGHGGRIASGPVSRREITDRFSRSPHAGDDPRLPLHLLLATDVLSEGLDLQGANVLVHLDLPWTVARLEQRIGRLRRLGSSHAAVFVYAMSAPLDRRACVSVVRPLLRKARLVESLVGLPVAALPSPLSLGPPRDRALETTDLAAAVESIRAELGAWRTHAAPLAADRDRPVVGVVTARGERPGWSAAALVILAAQPRLLAVFPDGVSDDPRKVLELIRAVPSGPVPDQSAERGADAARRALAQVGAWLDARRGEQLVAAALELPSPFHVQALRQIDGALRGLARHERGALAPGLESCRGLVLAARGAGAELALAGWLESLGPSSPHRRASMDDIARLQERLAARASPRRHALAAQPQAVVALLVIVPE